MKKTFLLKTMLLLCALIVGGSAWATPTTYNFSSIPTTGWSATNGGSQTINNISWTYSTATYLGATASQIQVGSKNNPQTSAWTIQTSVSNFGNQKKITAISITAYTTATTATYSISAGGSSVKSGSLTTSSATYTANNLNITSGNIVVTLTGSSTSKAMYLSNISVTYEDTGSGSDPSIALGSYSINAPETAVSTTTINVTYNNITDFAASLNFYESDGSTPASYDHSWLTAGINSTTKNLDYSITANTGAARTAYLKVHAVSNTADVESNLITITQAKKSVTTPTFSRDGGNYMEGLTFMLTSAGNTIYYTTDGSTPSNTSTEYTAPIAIAAGKVTYKAIAYDTYGNASNVKTCTYTGIAPATLPFSWTGTSTAGKSALGNVTGVAGYSLGSDYASSNAPYKLKFEAVNNYVTIFTNEKPETVYFTAKLFNAANTGSKIKVQGSADGITFTDIEEFTISGAANATFEFTTTHAFNTTHRAVKLVMSSKDQNVGVGTISISCLPVKITNAEYATFSNAHALDFSNTGIKVYTAKDNENSVTLSEVTTGKVPANTPVVLYKAGGATINVPVIASAPAITATNDLYVSDGTTALSNAYVLAMPDGEAVGFYPWDGTTLSAGKIYLQGSASYTRDFIGIGDASSISDVKVNTNLNGNYYDLQGRQVAQPTKGLYIVNGKKVIIK